MRAMLRNKSLRNVRITWSNAEQNRGVSMKRQALIGFLAAAILSLACAGAAFADTPTTLTASTPVMQWRLRVIEIISPGESCKLLPTAHGIHLAATSQDDVSV
ncbi:MAG TPA: hypothetical protein DCP91_06665 [Eggerthellaceae bacterium]|nr:hypothetical protein [Eggerthellaceae bacterium]